MSTPLPFISVEDELHTLRDDLGLAIKSAGLKHESPTFTFLMHVADKPPPLMCLWPCVKPVVLERDDYRGFVAAVNSNAFKLLCDFVFRCSLAPTTFQANQEFVSDVSVFNF